MRTTRSSLKTLSNYDHVTETAIVLYVQKIVIKRNPFVYQRRLSYRVVFVFFNCMHFTCTALCGIISVNAHQSSTKSENNKVKNYD